MKDTADMFADPLYSYPSDEPRVKIDYIFVSPDIEVISADIPSIEVSDHRPHIAEIVIK
jgi:endonuclease/exonuclease/phosphatase family metal-dependent hydrolase